MIRLDTTTKKLEIKLGGAHTTTAPKVTVTYYDVRSVEKLDNSEYRHTSTNTTTNGSTDVTICAAPAQVGTTRNIDGIMVYNADSVNATVTIKFDDGGTEYPIINKTLSSAQSLFYEHGAGWQVTP